ncbi:MAG: ketose-bisphosphate aldolase [Breznakia sp.]
MLVTSKEMLILARQEGHAIPAPDYIDLDSARAYVSAAEKVQKPLILSYAQAHSYMISLEEAALIGKFVAEQANVPICLHLDHGTDIKFIKKAITLGFTSVMIDASMKSFEENVNLTKEVVKFAHPLGVVVEAEIGHVGSGINYENHKKCDSVYTTVKDALNFVSLTNVDSLAVSIGTAHGIYKGIPMINFKRLQELSTALSIPLVLHGGSESGDDNLYLCATQGISKINIFTDFMISAMKMIEDEKPKNYFELKENVNRGMENVLVHYYKVFNKKEGDIHE